MIEITRVEFMNDPTFKLIHNEIMEHHEVPEFTIKELISKRLIKDICQEATHFARLKNDLYFHYVTSTWIKDKTFPVRIESITMYDDYAEWEPARVGQLYSAKVSDV